MARSKDRRGGGKSPRARSVGVGHQGAQQAADHGRSKGNRPAHPKHPTDVTTQPTGQQGSAPEGPRTLIDPDATNENRRSLARENSVATLLADKGYLLQQNPTEPEIAQARQDTGDLGTPRSHPDYLLEGRVFDCYSPNSATNPRNIWSYVEDKVEREQTQRVIVDLKEWRGGDVSKIEQQFHDWPIPNLLEVKIVTSNEEIIQIIPPSSID